MFKYGTVAFSVAFTWHLTKHCLMLVLDLFVDTLSYHQDYKCFVPDNSLCSPFSLQDLV